jgi:hypothetical protein
MSKPGPDPTSGSTTSPAAPAEAPHIDPRRERKQLTIFFAGCGFSLISALIARRGVIRRVNWARPTFFRQNHMHPEQKINGALEAMEAFSVATVNVFSWSILLTGGVMWATDTANIDEMRQRLRVRLGLKKEEQQGSQALVGEWLEAAKFWKGSSKKEIPKDVESSDVSSSSKGNKPES